MSREPAPARGARPVEFWVDVDGVIFIEDPADGFQPALLEAPRYNSSLIATLRKVKDRFPDRDITTLLYTAAQAFQTDEPPQGCSGAAVFNHVQRNVMRLRAFELLKNHGCDPAGVIIGSSGCMQDGGPFAYGDDFLRYERVVAAKFNHELPLSEDSLERFNLPYDYDSQARRNFLKQDLYYHRLLQLVINKAVESEGEVDLFNFKVPVQDSKYLEDWLNTFKSHFPGVDKLYEDFESWVRGYVSDELNHLGLERIISFFKAINWPETMSIEYCCEVFIAGKGHMMAHKLANTDPHANIVILDDSRSVIQLSQYILNSRNCHQILGERGLFVLQIDPNAQMTDAQERRYHDFLTFACHATQDKSVVVREKEILSCLIDKSGFLGNSSFSAKGVIVDETLLIRSERDDKPRLPDGAQHYIRLYRPYGRVDANGPTDAEIEDQGGIIKVGFRSGIELDFKVPAADQQQFTNDAITQKFSVEWLIQQLVDERLKFIASPQNTVGCEVAPGVMLADICNDPPTNPKKKYQPNLKSSQRVVIMPVGDPVNRSIDTVYVYDEFDPRGWKVFPKTSASDVNSNATLKNALDYYSNQNAIADDFHQKKINYSMKVSADRIILPRMKSGEFKPEHLLPDREERYRVIMLDETVQLLDMKEGYQYRYPLDQNNVRSLCQLTPTPTVAQRFWRAIDDTYGISRYVATRRSFVRSFLGVPKPYDETLQSKAEWFGYLFGGFVIEPVINVLKGVFEVIPYAIEQAFWHVKRSTPTNTAGKILRVAMLGLLGTLFVPAKLVRMVFRAIISPVKSFNHARKLDDNVSRYLGMSLSVITGIAAVALVSVFAPVLLAKLGAGGFVEAAPVLPHITSGVNAAISFMGFGAKWVAAQALAFVTAVFAATMRGVSKLVATREIPVKKITPDTYQPLDDAGADNASGPVGAEGASVVSTAKGETSCEQAAVEYVQSSPKKYSIDSESSPKVVSSDSESDNDSPSSPDASTVQPMVVEYGSGLLRKPGHSKSDIIPAPESAAACSLGNG